MVIIGIQFQRTDSSRTVIPIARTRILNIGQDQDGDNNKRSAAGAYSDLICRVRFRHVPYPFHGLVVALLENLQESYKETRCGEHDDYRIGFEHARASITREVENPAGAW